MSEREEAKDPAEIKESLDDIIQKLEQSANSSSSWNESISSNSEKWEQTKQQIQERQKALKNLVNDKKAGLISFDEFDKRYLQLQEELVELEKIIYNLKLGTDIQ